MPPAIWKPGMLIPKKARISSPVTRMTLQATKTVMATTCAVLRRWAGV